MYHFFFNSSCDKMLPNVCLLLRMALQHLLDFSRRERKRQRNVTTWHVVYWKPVKPHWLRPQSSSSSRWNGVTLCNGPKMRRDYNQPVCVIPMLSLSFSFFFSISAPLVGQQCLFFSPFVFFYLFFIVICAHRAPCRTGYHIRDY